MCRKKVLPEDSKAFGPRVLAARLEKILRVLKIRPNTINVTSNMQESSNMTSKPHICESI